MNDHSDFEDFPGLDAIAGHAARAQRGAVAFVSQPEIKRSRRWTPIVIGAFSVAAIVALVAVIATNRPTPISVSGSKAVEHYAATFVPENLPLYSATEGSEAANTVESPVWLFGDPGDPLGPKTFGVTTGPTTAEGFDEELSSGIGTRTNVNGNAGYIVSGDSGAMSVLAGQSTSVTWRVGTKRFAVIAPHRTDAELTQLAASIDTASAVPGTSSAGFSPLGEGSADIAIPLMVSSSASSSVTYGVGASADSAAERVIVLTAQDRASSLPVLVLFGGQKTTFKGGPALSTHWEIPLDSSPKPMTFDQLSWADATGSLVTVAMTGGDADKVRKVAEGLKTVDVKTWQAMVAKSKIDHPEQSCDGAVTSSGPVTATIALAPASTEMGTVAEGTLASPPEGTAVSPSEGAIGVGTLPLHASPTAVTVVAGGPDGTVFAPTQGSESIVQAGSNGGGFIYCGGGTAVAEPALQHDPTPSDLPYGSTVEIPNLPPTKVRWGQSNNGSNKASNNGSNNGWTLSVEDPTSSASTTGPASPIVQTSISSSFSSVTNDTIPTVFGIAKVGLDVELMPLSLSDAEASTYTQGIPVTKSADAPQGGYFAFGVAAPIGSPTPLHLVARDATSTVVWSGPMSYSFDTNSPSKSATASTSAGTAAPTTS